MDILSWKADWELMLGHELEFIPPLTKVIIKIVQPGQGHLRELEGHDISEDGVRKVRSATVVVDQGELAQVRLEGKRVARAHRQNDDRGFHADVQAHLDDHFERVKP